MTILTIYRLAKPFLPWIAGVLLIFGLIFYISDRSYQKGSHSRDPEVAALNQSIANLKAVSAQAAANNLATVRAVETRQDTITKEATDALETQLADARVAASRYAASLRTQAGSRAGDAGRSGLSEAADAAGGADGAGETTVMDADLQACAEGVTKAEGWQHWWAKVAAIAP